MKKRKQNTQSIIQAIAAGTALLQVLAVSLVTLGFVLSANANERKTAIVTFDVPGAQGTEANAISPDGTITGSYFDSGGLGHGFVRARNGTFITFDPPGVSTVPGLNTAPWGINPAGTTAGWWYTNIGPSFFAHGFLRTRDGAFTTFDVPGASQTFGLDINAAGTVAGYYNAGGGNAPDLFRSFVRDRGGAITTFAAPGAGTGPGQGTFTTVTNGLNPGGAVTGWYLDANNVFHGFVRTSNGAITTFDVPGAGTGTGSFQGTFPEGINPEGAVTGASQDASNVLHGFVRAPNGAITTFDVPGAGTAAFQGTLAFTPSGAISAAGTILGNYIDASNVVHGFVRAPNDVITSFDAPGAGTGFLQGTFPTSFNPAGAIVGFYVDANNVSHGFLLQGE
jgi:hypothetical protein